MKVGTTSIYFNIGEGGDNRVTSCYYPALGEGGGGGVTEKLAELRRLLILCFEARIG